MAKLFFALWPNEEIRTQIENVNQQFRNKGFRLTKKPNLHITLEFLGEISASDQKELVNKINELRCESFDLELTRIGWWRKPAILWIGTTNIPKPLTSLVKSIKKCVDQQGLNPDQREYNPHVTIARKVKQVIIPKETFNIAWHVNSIALVISKSTDGGVEYRVLQDWPLTN